MATLAARSGLAYDDRGAGQPVVFLHGLTFDRSNWRPIVDRLGSRTRSLAVDLPGHGESGGGPCSLWEVADRVQDLSDELGLERPIVVGHSMSGGIASIYGATYPALGVVNVDQTMDVRPFAQMLRSAWPALSGPGFDGVFEQIRKTMGMDLIPEPVRSRVLASQRANAELVLGYWAELHDTDPDEMQARIEEMASGVQCPYLAVFGHCLEPSEREYTTALVADLQMEEWEDSGHFVHLVHVDRFSARLSQFIDSCRSGADSPEDG